MLTRGGPGEGLGVSVTLPAADAGYLPVAVPAVTVHLDVSADDIPSDFSAPEPDETTTVAAFIHRHLTAHEGSPHLERVASRPMLPSGTAPRQTARPSHQRRSETPTTAGLPASAATALQHRPPRPHVGWRRWDDQATTLPCQVPKHLRALAVTMCGRVDGRQRPQPQRAAQRTSTVPCISCMAATKMIRVSDRTRDGFRREAQRRGVTIDEVAAAALRALRQKEMGEQLAAPLGEDEAEWLDASLR